jgi:hypothetical protein
MGKWGPVENLKAKAKFAYFVILLVKWKAKDFLLFIFPTCVDWIPVVCQALCWALGKPG